MPSTRFSYFSRIYDKNQLNFSFQRNSYQLSVVSHQSSTISSWFPLVVSEVATRRSLLQRRGLERKINFKGELNGSTSFPGLFSFQFLIYFVRKVANRSSLLQGYVEI